MVSSIGAYASDILQYLQISQNASEKIQTSQSLSFEELIGNGKITQHTQEDSSTGITTIGSISESSKTTATETYSEMDLNQDGQVTIDEIMRYNEMQMMEKMQEQMTEQNSDDSNLDENNKKANDEKSELAMFKTKMAAKAYQIGESLITASIGAITQNFAV